MCDLNKKELNERLLECLINGVCEFSYEKSDGSIRNARGTLNVDMCPETKGTEKKPNESIQVYYDLDKESWRCFKKDKLVDVKY